MNKKLGLVFLLFAGISGIGMASDGPKKYAFGLVQQAAEDYNNNKLLAHMTSSVSINI